MRLLVVGASGFVGKNVVALAANSGWTVAGTYLRAEDFPRYAAALGCEAIRYDLLSKIRTWDADVAVYLAGNSDHRASLASPAEDLRRNVEGLVLFLEGFSGGVVFLGSAAVYDGLEGRVSPESTLRPRLPYAISKLASEHYLRSYESRDRIPWATALRLYYAYGPYDRPSRLFPRVIQASRSGARVFEISSIQGSLLDPLYSEDVARAVLAAARGNARGRTLDLCSGHSRPVPDLVREILGALGSDMALVERPQKEETPARFLSDPKPCQEELGLGSFLPIREGVSRTAAWLAGAEA